jgi:hypothetical protein
VPFNIKRQDYRTFLKFLHENIGAKVVFKKWLYPRG